jgi:hypothetical protein
MQLGVALLLALQGSSTASAAFHDSDGVRSAATELRICFEEAAQERLPSDEHVEQMLASIKDFCREYELRLKSQLSLHAAELEAQTGRGLTPNMQRAAAEAMLEHASQKARRRILKHKAAVLADGRPVTPVR